MWYTGYMRQEFRGRTFDIEYRDIGGEVTGCCQDESELIEISTRIKGRTRLDTEIHESLHACLPMLHEHIVETTASNIAAFLWRLGYRPPGATP